jgi:cytochrome P450
MADAAVKPIFAAAMSLLDRVRKPPLAATLDLAEPRAARDPFPLYEALRRTGPVHYLARHGFWIVLGHDEVRAAFEQAQAFSNASYDEVDAVLLAADPPDHTPIRRVVSRLFSGDALARLTGFAAAKAERLLQPRFDIVGEYAVPVTRAVAAELIGFDGGAVAAIDRHLAEAEREGAPFGEVTKFLDRIAERAALYGAFREADFGGFSDREARSLIRLLWLAATTTTERAIVHASLHLLEDEGLRAKVGGDTSLLAPFVEEILRLHPPEMLVRRVTVREVELGGVAIPAGASVQLCLAAANRDPRRFPEPGKVRLDRPQKQHLAFGFGLHFCPGAALARRLVPVALEPLLRNSGLRPLEPLDRLAYVANLSTLVPRRLPVAL